MNYEIDSMFVVSIVAFSCMTGIIPGVRSSCKWKSRSLSLAQAMVSLMQSLAERFDARKLKHGNGMSQNCRPGLHQRCFVEICALLMLFLMNCQVAQSHNIRKLLTFFLCELICHYALLYDSTYSNFAQFYWQSVCSYIPGMCALFDSSCSVWCKQF